ncbi:D-alanyl-D-alanine carboxypeptidase family protein [Microvirga tunisiensis]|uniref:serine-type D-Ala-D-Ala carboxypeptidase n=1 Tax=Microvirga tunisiensis TaxID=2108360 RepID=A0A5N7MDM4_9HYPH|nr:D-alanyl-D-alanine carboxypeptidase family protein [Microvirga tunisiensis]MPR06645.1 D-alanyl-D-alanine carboxypeptidase [Microvirga tunisiensis]MPR24758.1 D-alanyl-D-alanine carboxypeptidase [Microvirga tunisiensis]
MRHVKVARCLAVFGFVWSAISLVSAWPQVAQAQAQNFQTSAPTAILMDAGSHAVLFEKNADELTAPASMAKTMTAEVVFNEIKNGRLSFDSEFTISENAWRKGGAGSGGSSMFAKVNTPIRLEDLLRGLIIQSGNDAAIAIAEGVAGTEDNFARMMNERAKQIGLTKSTFRNATGYGHPEQKTTVRDLSKLALHIIETYPDLYKIFGEREFTWNKIRQQNRNPLVFLDIGADGLKTGNIDESGYGLIGSAVQNDQRLIVVVNGLKTAKDRAAESRKLLDWGFRAFETQQLFAEGQVVGEAQVFGGNRRSLPLVSKKPIRVLVPRGEGERVTARIVYTGPLKAPVQKGTEVARLQVNRGDMQALEMPLYANEDVQEGTLSQRALDGLLEFSTGWVRRAFTSVIEGI